MDNQADQGMVRLRDHKQFGMENKECKGFYLHIAKGGKEEEKKRFNV